MCAPTTARNTDTYSPLDLLPVLHPFLHRFTFLLPTPMLCFQTFNVFLHVLNILSLPFSYVLPKMLSAIPPPAQLNMGVLWKKKSLSYLKWRGAVVCLARMLVSQFIWQGFTWLASQTTGASCHRHFVTINVPLILKVREFFLLFKCVMFFLPKTKK